MATNSGLILNFSGCKIPGAFAGYRQLLSQNHNHGLCRFHKLHDGLTSVSRGITNLPTLYLHNRRSGSRCYSSAGRNYQLSYNDSSQTGPSWLNSVVEAVRKIRGLLVFLVEQPSQLKYIEWPSFQSTLKTATLTLILVVLLIVALSSVDSALSFVLALLLRKKA